MKVQLKVGDNVRVKGTKARDGKVIKFQGESILVYFWGWDWERWYTREELRKLPELSSKSKLAGQNNFWQGRARSVCSQIKALLAQLPVEHKDSRDITEQLNKAHDCVSTAAYIVKVQVERKLEKSK